MDIPLHAGVEEGPVHVANADRIGSTAHFAVLPMAAEHLGYVFIDWLKHPIHLDNPVWRCRVDQVRPAVVREPKPVLFVTFVYHRLRHVLAVDGVESVDALHALVEQHHGLVSKAAALHESAAGDTPSLTETDDTRILKLFVDVVLTQHDRRDGLHLHRLIQLGDDDVVLLLEVVRIVLALVLAAPGEQEDAAIGRLGYGWVEVDVVGAGWELDDAGFPQDLTCNRRDLFWKMLHQRFEESPTFLQVIDERLLSFPEVLQVLFMFPFENLNLFEQVGVGQHAENPVP